MLKNIIGNKHAKKLLVRYLENANSEIDTPSSVLLYGHKGVGKSCIAKYMAKSLVGCSDIDTHPDIRYVDNLSTADELSELLTFCSYISIMGKYKVVILDNAEQIPIALQNKLLKTIEEPQNVIFIFVCNGALLNTIHSRTFNVCFSPVTEDELQKYINQTGDNSLPLCIYDGSIGKYHTMRENSEFSDFVKGLLNSFANISDRTIIFDLFHAWCEKDNKYIYEVFNTEQMESIFLLLETLFYEVFLDITLGIKGTLISYDYMKRVYSLNEVMEILELIKEHKVSLRKNYNKNDFFQFLCVLA